MNDWLLEELEDSKEEVEEKIKDLKMSIKRLDQKIHLNENIVETEDYQENMTEEQLEVLKYETTALKDMKICEKADLEEAEKEKAILEFKIRYRSHRLGK